MVDVVISSEEARGCGRRKPAKDGVGIYLVGPADGVGCGRMPFELHSCPVCNMGIKASRGWNWIEPRGLFGQVVDPCIEGRRTCERCPLGLGVPEGRHGLIWIGEKFYDSPADFLSEAKRMGVSRKIKAVPRGFELGKTWVFLAHRAAVRRFNTETGTTDDVPAIFSSFMPTGIDLVIADENNVPERAVKLAEEHGARIVKVVPAPNDEPAAAAADAPQRSLPLAH